MLDSNFHQNSPSRITSIGSVADEPIYLGQRPLNHQISAADVQRGAGDVGGAVGGQEGDELGDF